jgi:hypothetical protein
MGRRSTGVSCSAKDFVTLNGVTRKFLEGRGRGGVVMIRVFDVGNRRAFLLTRCQGEACLKLGLKDGGIPSC